MQYHYLSVSYQIEMRTCRILNSFLFDGVWDRVFHGARNVADEEMDGSLYGGWNTNERVKIKWLTETQGSDSHTD